MEKCQDFAMDSFLEELEVFRWRLYIAKDESAIERRNLFEEACSKQISELFIEECLIAGCDTNSLSNESKLMVKKLMHKGDMLPSIQRDDDKFWDFSRLRMCLLYGNEPLFMKGLKLIARKNPDKLREIIANSSDLLNIAASNHLTLTIETLVAYGGKVEYPAFLSACKSGSWQSLEILLQHLDLEENKMPLLRELYNSARIADESRREHYEKCYDLLLNESNFDVNSMDSHGRSAMYYVSNLPKKIDQFLEMGTYVGMQNGSTTPNVSFIAPAALEAHFNNCVNFVQSEDNKKVTYLEFDFKNLIAPRAGHDNNQFVFPNEMTAIQFISQSVDYKHLLVHPLIWSFISLKWRQLALIRSIDCALYVVFALSNLCYVLALYGDAPNEITNVFFILTGNMTFYVAIRRIVHLLFCSNEYRRTLINYFHCYQTFQVIVSVSLVHYLEDINPVIPAMCVLLITCELFVLAGSIFWTFSLYYIMFLSIAWSSMKSLMVYIVLLPSFIISYWLMITNKEPNIQENTYKNQFFDYMQQALVPNSADPIGDSQLENFKKKFFSLIRKFIEEEDDSDHENTSTVVLSLMKAIIGWHRDVDDKIASVEWTFLGLLIVMISLVSIINMNLVNSLAVTGTQAIQSKSELTCLTQRVHLLIQYEESLTNQKHWFWQTFKKTPVMRLFDFFAQFDVLESIRPDNHRKVYIGPGNEIIYRIQSQNQSSKSGDVGIVSKALFSPKKGSQVDRKSKDSEENEDTDESQRCCSQLWKKFIGIFFNKTDRMNPQIVENARNVIDRRKDDQKEKSDIDTCIHRIEKLETVITTLTKKLDVMVKFEN
ncbi:transient receptor potential cation channel protein painless-like [Sitodiplosis mosellana]|uniref:transient receptor potential cation channel protein painless-like n=1 Tax=Sitodiplosis mosellana TaxID=263140 RepID=UPI0024445B7B|nr:transient receptor potential cation channel protein painless-like [Sitodiplosis mosellana]